MAVWQLQRAIGQTTTNECTRQHNGLSNTFKTMFSKKRCVTKHIIKTVQLGAVYEDAVNKTAQKLKTKSGIALPDLKQTALKRNWWMAKHRVNLYSLQSPLICHLGFRLVLVGRVLCGPWDLGVKGVAKGLSVDPWYPGLFGGITYLFGWLTDCVPASSDFAELTSS